jgi:hypothetical protein
MVIAVIGMRVVQHAVDQVVGVIAVRDRGMAATGSVHVLVLVVYRSARIGVGVIDFEAALVNVSVMVVVQVAIMQIVDVSVVADRCMAAIRSMGVIVPLMSCVFHRELLFVSSIQEFMI